MRKILIITKNGFEGFTSLKPFFVKHPEFEKYTPHLRYVLSRKKENIFECEDFVLIRLEVNQGKVDYDVSRIQDILNQKSA